MTRKNLFTIITSASKVLNHIINFCTDRLNLISELKTSLLRLQFMMAALHFLLFVIHYCWFYEYFHCYIMFLVRACCVLVEILLRNKSMQYWLLNEWLKLIFLLKARYVCLQYHKKIMYEQLQTLRKKLHPVSSVRVRKARVYNP